MMNQKTLKTPLRYPGGKSRAITKISQFFPDLTDFKEFREPFLGGGSVALWVTKQYPHLDIWVNDLYEPLANFWSMLRTNSDEMTVSLVNYKKTHPDHDTARELFEEAKQTLADNKKDKLNRAIAFYIVNKCSFSGLSEASSFSKQASDSNFSMRGIEKLPEYAGIIRNWRITNVSYELLLGGKGSFVYLDPPYDIGSNLYGKKGGMQKYFHHTNFSKACTEADHHLVVSYNSSNLNTRRFNGWKAVEYDHTYTMRSTAEYTTAQKNRKELVLTNF
jgi:DNA adenine methylase